MICFILGIIVIYLVIETGILIDRQFNTIQDYIKVYIVPSIFIIILLWILK